MCRLSLICALLALSVLVGCSKNQNPMTGSDNLEKVQVVDVSPQLTQEQLQGQTVVRRQDGTTVTIPGRIGDRNDTIAVPANKLNYGGNR